MMNRFDPPRFITIEGGEGAGKTTLIKRLEEVLVSWDCHVVVTREPGGSALGNKIRQWLLEGFEGVQIGPKAELLMFLAARAQHIEEVIAPALAEGKIVLCDRFNDSTIAYQGAGRSLSASFVADLCAAVCGPVVPTLTFYLDLDPEIGLLRTKGLVKENAGAGEVDRIEAEKIGFHKQVRNAFLETAKKEQDRFITIDASQSMEQVFEACRQILSDRLGKKLRYV